MNFNPNDLAGVLPAIILTLGGCALMTTEVFLRKEGADRRYQPFLAAVFGLIGLYVALNSLGDPTESIFAGAAVADGIGRSVSAIVCATLVLSALLSFGYLETLNASRGEFYALALLSAAGMCILAQATDLLVMFIALEVMSLAVYCLTAWLRRGKKPAEAAFKYFVLGSFASAIFLYGAALAYGAVGSTRIADLAMAVRNPHALAPTLTYAAGALLLAGFAFKVAAVPFHMWVADVYDGAPAPVTGFMAAGVKAAGFVALARVLVSGYGDQSAALGAHGWQTVIAVLASATMLVGNVLAVPQRSVKRMLAYSSIAHAGYLLVAIAAMAGQEPRPDAAFGLVFYLGSYAATVVGAFGIVALIERKLAATDASDDLSSWAGLSQKHPALAAAMSLFMFSLAGVPPTAGFMAKLSIFRSAIEAGLYPLAIFGVLTSAAGLYYYLRVIVYVYMVPSSKPEPIVGGRMITAGIALATCAALVIWMGVQPGAFASMAQQSLASFGK